MRLLRRTSNVALILAATNSYLLCCILPIAAGWKAIVVSLLIISFLYVNIRPSSKDCQNIRLRALSCGSELLILFMLTSFLNFASAVFMFAMTAPKHINLSVFLINCVIAVILEAIVFWNGIIRVYLTSVQLGIKTRVIGILLGWIPVANIIALIRIYKITSRECVFETEKVHINEARCESRLCKTKYPLLLVHGVFFRDVKYLNYWGRIPGELEANGAKVFYGKQQSAASIEKSAEELLLRIKNIVRDTGCGKVNVIAHSKGGLDSRYLISCLGGDEYVASLTTINTPHRGCIFAEYLLNKASDSFKTTLAAKYNRTMERLGDKDPDFISAVTDLTCSRCEAINTIAKDKETVFYQSVGSAARNARSGKFPLNVSYPLVRHFDGKNDGLVSVESARWGDNFTLISVPGKRGVTHADVIDLNRENIDGFDVREFYVELVADLKEKGF